MNKVRRPRHLKVAGWLGGLLLAGGVTGCRLDMHDQPKYESYEASEFFADGQASRTPPAGTVAQGRLFEDEMLYTGKVDGEAAGIFPFPITEEVLRRGQERFDIYCSPCHDRVGTGQGVIVRRGMKRPPSLHIIRLQEAPPGYFFDVITNGFGAMFSYASRLAPEDRWAVAAYIRALQLSQSATEMDVAPEDMKRLRRAGRPATNRA